MPRRKQILFFLLFIILSKGLLAQGFNHNFLVGYATGLDSYTTSKRAWLQFDQSSIAVNPDSFKMPLRATQANISDANGNILMVSNGVWIANATGDTMQNGSGLNPNSFTTSWETTGLPYSHANIIIPYPGDSTKFVLFHQTGNDTVFASRPSQLYYTVIDMSLAGGLGGVPASQKNLVAFQDILSAGIAACKHANGRDWWIVALKDSSDLIYKILFTPTGIASITTQHLGYTSPLPYLNACQPTFSPDGTKFAYTFATVGANAFIDCRLFNFDRCSGNFDTLAYFVKTGENGFATAFSPSSKYLYFGSLARIYQVNTDTTNIPASLDTVAAWDGTYSPIPPFATYFWFLYLAANGKIYVTSGGTVDIGFINNPDSDGLACDVQQHALHLPCYSARASVNHPNYYLGCDTTGGCLCFVNTTEAEQHDFHFKIFPNPNNGNFSISYLMPQNKEGELEIWDVTGKIIYTQKLPTWSTLQNISLPQLSDGIYNCVITSNNQRTNRKIAVIKY